MSDQRSDSYTVEDALEAISTRLSIKRLAKDSELNDDELFVMDIASDALTKLRMQEGKNAAPQVPDVREAPGNPIASSPAVAAPSSRPESLPEGWIACSERMPDKDGEYLTRWAGATDD